MELKRRRCSSIASSRRFAGQGVGDAFVPVEQIALVEPFDPASNPDFKPAKEFKARIVLLNRDISPSLRHRSSPTRKAFLWKRRNSITFGTRFTIPSEPNRY